MHTLIPSITINFLTSISNNLVDNIEPPVKSKRMKKEETEEKKEVKMDDTKLKEMCDEGELMQLTNGRLKELCEQRGMKIGRETKRDMVKKLQDYIDKVKK